MFASGPCPARPERARCNGLGESRRLALAAAGADNAQALMLGHPHGHHRQFLDLTARRRTDRDPVGHTEPMPADAVSRPVLDDLVDRPRRQQRAALALMPWLSALLAPRRVLAAPWRRAGRIGAGRLRRVPRRALGLALELRDPLLLTRDPRRQLLDLRRQPLILRRQRQQDLDSGIATLVTDRLRLGPLHSTRFDSARLCPPTQLNAYGFRATRYRRGFPGFHRETTGVWAPNGHPSWHGGLRIASRRLPARRPMDGS